MKKTFNKWLLPGRQLLHRCSISTRVLILTLKSFYLQTINQTFKQTIVDITLFYSFDQIQQL